MIRNTSWCVAVLALLFVGSCKERAKKQDTSNTKEDVTIEWQQLFNGKDLTGWVPKISKHKTGENFAETFRVEDGNLVVRYDQYDDFDHQFGHLHYEKPFSAYFLNVEYRFVGEQSKGGEEWAWRNSGVMLHGQDPNTMTVEQDFPISIEAQLLGGNGTDERSNLNLCTPGTHVVIKDSLVEDHCISSTSKTYHGDQWVKASFLVLKDSLIQHIVDGKVVMEYSKPQIGGGVVHNFNTDVKKDGTPITSGYISLQSESHPIEFKTVELVDLEPIYDDKKQLKKTVEALLKKIEL